MPPPALNTASGRSDTGTAVRTGTALREHTIRVHVTLAPVAAGRAARFFQNGHRAHCVIQPADGAYLPAVLTRDASSPAPTSACLLVVYLAAGEPDTLFPPGRRFTIWADVLVGQAVQGRGLLGHGTTCEQEPPAAQTADSPATGVADPSPAVSAAGCPVCTYTLPGPPNPGRLDP
jgi:hypothetical protein